MKPAARLARAPGTGRPALRPWVDAPPPAPASGPAEARQRWRIVYERPAGAPAVTQRDELQAWEAGLAASGLPVAGLDGPRGRPRLQFGAPLPQGMAAERELADTWLVERLTVDRVRPAIEAALPAGFRLVDLHDVWLGVPPLPADVVAADYRIVLEPGAPPAFELATAGRRLLAADRLERQRPKGGGTVRYDLRPLLDDVAVIAPGPPPVLRVRVRFDQALGHGRPDEVLAALADLTGAPVSPATITRERLVLASSGQRAAASRHDGSPN